MARKTLDWLLDGGWLLLGGSLVLLVAVALLSHQPLFQCKERDIRLVGLFLEVVGLGTAALGLRDVSHHFGTPRPLSRLRDYWQRRPFLRQMQSIEASASSIMALSTFARARVRIVPSADTPLSERMTMAERELAALYTEVDRLEAENERTGAELRQAIAAEAAARGQADAALRRTIQETLADGVALEWLGLACFVLGVVLGTAAPEWAALFGHPTSCG